VRQNGFIDPVLLVMGALGMLSICASRHLVVDPTDDFLSADVHREALVRSLLSPFF